MVEFDTVVRTPEPCTIGIGPGTKGRRWDVDRIHNTIGREFPQMEVVQEFHRTTNKGIDLYSQRLDLNVDRTGWPELNRLLRNYETLMKEIQLEMARNDSPELYEEAVRDFGEEKAKDIFTTHVESSDRVFPIPGGDMEGTQAEILMLLDFSNSSIGEDEFIQFVRREHKGTVVRVDERGDGIIAFGVWPQSPSIKSLRGAVNSVLGEFTVIAEPDVTIICDTFRVVKEDG